MVRSKRTMITDQCDEVAKRVMCDIVNSGGEMISQAIRRHAECQVENMNREADAMREEIRGLREELRVARQNLSESEFKLGLMKKSIKDSAECIVDALDEGNDSCVVCLKGHVALSLENKSLYKMGCDTARGCHFFVCTDNMSSMTRCPHCREEATFHFIL